MKNIKVLAMLMMMFSAICTLGSTSEVGAMSMQTIKEQSETQNITAPRSIMHRETRYYSTFMYPNEWSIPFSIYVTEYKHQYMKSYSGSISRGHTYQLGSQWVVEYWGTLYCNNCW
ncbi:hypothetical protein NSQ26_02640 [Bacillus sp. FSL W7-1360]